MAYLVGAGIAAFMVVARVNSLDDVAGTFLVMVDDFGEPEGGVWYRSKCKYPTRWAKIDQGAWEV